MFPSHSRLYSYLRGTGIVVLLMWAVAVVHAADVSVRAHLSRSISVIGDPVELQIKTSGGRRIGAPPDVSVDGLEIQYIGPSTEMKYQLDGTGLVSERTP